MRYLLVFLLVGIYGISAQAQSQPDQIEGTVSYITSQNVYVKFKSTTNVAIGDTLFMQQGDSLLPVLKVKDLSSISCVCKPISTKSLSISDRIFHIKSKVQVMPPILAETKDDIRLIQDSISPLYDTLQAEPSKQKKRVQDIYGFASVAAFSDFSNTPAGNSLKMKYTISFNMKNIGHSKLSAESYITFVHRDNNWNDIQANIFNGLKIYNLSFSYKFNNKFELWLGRKINPKISNMGAVDGVQFEMRFKPITIGILGGARPNYPDYGFNFNLLQFGAYVSHNQPTKNGYLQSTLAFVQQMNSGQVDRRFVYLQHSNSVVKNLTFFGSVEVDFFNKKLNPEDSTLIKDNSPKLSNLYLSLRYRILKKVSLSFSYSARKNVIYYETYKTFLEELLDTETLQGYRLQVTYRPVKKLSIGVSGSYRFQKVDPRPSKNLYTYITYSQIPAIKISSTISFIILETGYLSGKVYSAGISKDFFSGKFYTGLAYRYVDYKFSNSGSHLIQNLAEISLTWRIIRKLSFSIYYEGTFEKIYQYNRMYARLNFRF